MSQYSDLTKIIKKGKKIEQPTDLQESLLRHIANNYSDSFKRELDFLTLYYGLRGSSETMTLEAIGKTQTPNLTRERVRQIIDSILTTLKNDACMHNPYNNTHFLFMETLEHTAGVRNFLRNEELFLHPYFAPFKKNMKGFIAFLNDCGIRQIAYRKHYYFYPAHFNREQIINEIQKENKVNRKIKTMEKMSQKAKTVTYVPDDVRQYLLESADKKKMNLNPLYEEIIKEFIENKPYLKSSFEFSKTKSWKARKGKAQWQQIGIYIEKDVFQLIKECVSKIKLDLNKRVSLMSFICQAFVWHKDKYSHS